MCGDDTPLRVDALRLASVYRELFDLWHAGTLRPCGNAFIRSEKCRAYGFLGPEEQGQLIETIKAAIPLAVAESAAPATNADMWGEG